MTAAVRRYLGSDKLELHHQAGLLLFSKDRNIQGLRNA